MVQVKYMAAGFLHDAEQLLSDFVEENTMDFSVFSNIWRKRNFSLIYMGRGSESELSQFTQHIFCLSARFLTSNYLIYSQVGAIYLLYALYRNQILVPLRIRLMMNQWKVLIDVRKMVDLKENKSLHYVIDYLVEHSLDLVACSSLMGPNIPLFRRKGNPDVIRLNVAEMAALKSNLIEFTEGQILQNLAELYAKYTKSKSLICGIGATEESVHHFVEFIRHSENLISDAQLPCEKLEDNFKNSPTPGQRSIGSRRVELKANALSNYIYENMDSHDVCVITNKRESTGGTKHSAKKNGRPKSTKESANVETQFPNKPQFINKFNMKKPRTWHYSEQNGTSCDHPIVYRFDVNPPLLTDGYDPLSSETDDSETIDAPVSVI